MIISTVKSVAIEVGAVTIAFAVIALAVQIPLINVEGLSIATAWVVLAATPLCAFHVMRVQKAAGSKQSEGTAPQTSNPAAHASPKITLSIHAHALEADELAASKSTR